MFIVNLFSSLMLIGANFLEFFMGANPCSLCWYQRFCWMAVLIVSLLFKYIYKYTYFIIALLIINIFIGSYQLLLQYKIIISSNVCKIDSLSLNLSTLPDCSLIDFTIFNLPLSFYNVVSSLLLLVYVIHYSLIIVKKK